MASQRCIDAGVALSERLKAAGNSFDAEVVGDLYRSLRASRAANSILQKKLEQALKVVNPNRGNEGFVAQLSARQTEAALAYTGPDSHGDAAAPPHPASKEVGADELQGLIVTHEIAAERMAARIAELERENARLLNAFDGIVDQPASHGEGGA